MPAEKGIIPSSLRAKRTFNPIRNIVDSLKPDKNHPKTLINLALGDPTVYGNLRRPALLTDSVQYALESIQADGYLPSTGLTEAKRSISNYLTERNSLTSKWIEGCGKTHIISEEDVIIASGCSGAVELALSVLLNEGDNILVPKPGFPLYRVIAESIGAHVKYYALIPESNWDIDLEALEREIDGKTKAILITNPSNPCGSNYSAEHLSSIAALAERYGLPVIADEIYGGCVFNGHGFTSMAAIEPSVPLLSLGGIAKEFLVPGWRVGWVTVHDGENSSLSEVRRGLTALSQLILGANSLIQAALPRLLDACTELLRKKKEKEKEKKEQIGAIDYGMDDLGSLMLFRDQYMGTLRSNVERVRELTEGEGWGCPEVKVMQPNAAMYAMVKLDTAGLSGVCDDQDFARILLEEENVVVLPGKCFGIKDYIRIIICPPAEVLMEAFQRIKLFCIRHRTNHTIVTVNSSFSGLKKSVSQCLTKDEESERKLSCPQFPMCSSSCSEVCIPQRPAKRAQYLHLQDLLEKSLITALVSGDFIRYSRESCPTAAVNTGKIHNQYLFEGGVDGSSESLSDFGGADSIYSGSSTTGKSAVFDIADAVDDAQEDSCGVDVDLAEHCKRKRHYQAYAAALANHPSVTGSTL